MSMAKMDAVRYVASKVLQTPGPLVNTKDSLNRPKTSLNHSAVSITGRAKNHC